MQQKHYQNIIQVQPKLTVNTPGDIYEQEADAMADRVMRMSSTETVNPVTGLIGKSLQRKCANCEEEEKKQNPIMRKVDSVSSGMSVSSSFAASLNTSKGGGSPLPQGTKSFMENAFSADFSSVKIHTDSKAAEMSTGINAKAFTQGSDIYFGTGQYSTNSNSGKSLLAHELTHVVQQKCNIKNKISRKRMSTDYVGKNIGINNYDELVTVKKEIGFKDGFENKYQAVAAARLAEAEPAAVVEDYYGLWHAYEITANFYGGLKVAYDFSPPTKRNIGLPSLKQVQEEKAKDKRSVLYASLALGLEESEIQFNRNSIDRKTGIVNFNGLLETEKSEIKGITGPEKGITEFDEDQKYAIEISTEMLDDPEKAQGVLYHESSHLYDFQLAQSYVQRYKKETKKYYVKSHTSEFVKWLKSQTDISEGFKELIIYEISNSFAISEAKAYITTVLTSIVAGALPVAENQMKNYIKQSMPPTGSVFIKEFKVDILSKYAKMGEAEKILTKSIFENAVKEKTDIWFSDIKFK